MDVCLCIFVGGNLCVLMELWLYNVQLHTHLE